MNKKFARFALPVLVFAFAGVAQAAPQTVVDFDEWGSTFFSTSSRQVNYVDGTLSEYNNSGYRSVADAISPNQWVATNFREYTTVSFSSTSGELFDLNSVWLAGAWGSQTVTITGYANGAEIYSTTVDITSTAQEYSFTSFLGLDKFTITKGSNFVQDSWATGNGATWVLGGANVTVVPEPEAYAMLLAGLGLVGAIARRRQRR